MKNLFTLLLSVLFTSLLFGQELPFDMVYHEGSIGDDRVFDICTDDVGNKYITGKYDAEINFGNGISITPLHNFDVFVAKYDKDNNILWAKSFGGSSADEGNAVAVDNYGNVIVASVFLATVSFEQDTLFSSGNFDIAFVKFDSEGNYLWMKRAYTINQDKISDLKVDNEGNYVALGFFDVNDELTLPLKYEGLEIFSKGEKDVFVIKMDSDGNPIWGISGGGTSNETPGGLVIDKNNNIYFNGDYDNVEATFGSTTLPNLGGKEIFVAKLNSSGEYQWAVSANGIGDDLSTAIDYKETGTESGKVIISGYFHDSLYAGTSNELFESVGSNDIIVLEFTNNGEYEYGFSYGGEGDDQAKAINFSTRLDDNYFVSGMTKGNLIFNGKTLTNYGSSDMFVMQVNKDSLIWVKNYGGSSYDYLETAVMNQNGVLNFAGYFKSPSSQFDNYSLSTNGGYDLWIGQMHEPTPFSAPEILSITDIPNDQGGKVRLEFAASELANSFSIWRQIDSTYEWDAIGSFDGLYQNKYSFVAPTLGDSTIHGIKWSNFKISAHSNNVLDYFVSEPMLAYSIDNLAPVVPSGIIAFGNDASIKLAWDDNIDDDFQYYGIYRSLDSEFNPDTMNTYSYSTIEKSFSDVDVVIGNTYYYYLTSVDFSGNRSELSEKISVTTTDINLENGLPTVYNLGQNYPNPFNPSTIITYSLPESGLITIKVFNILGEEISTLVNEVKPVGVYEVSFNASNLTTGMYIYRIEAGEFTSTKKMMLVK